MNMLLLLLLLFQLVFSVSSHTITQGNPANELVKILNNNRTLHKLSNLMTSPGLGCLALQYAKSCIGNCTNNTLHCRWNEDDFIQVFAPNCGVELPTYGIISSRIVGCHSKYLKPSQAFTQVLVTNTTTASQVHNKSLKDVGIGIIGHHKGPFFWCILFSTDKTNSTFILEEHGEGIKQRSGGCYSSFSSYTRRQSCTSNAQPDHLSSSILHALTLICIYVLLHLFP